MTIFQIEVFMIVDINAVISSKLTDIDRQVRELQQTAILYGIRGGQRDKRLQAIRKTWKTRRHSFRSVDASCPTPRLEHMIALTEKML
jgi:hypothetical protein